MKDDKIKELLKVPGMPEEEQFEWLEDNNVLATKDYVYAPDFEGYQLDKKATFADLAFRLRDEVVTSIREDWGRAILKINIKYATNENYDCWWQNHSKPIHWIIAALIALRAEKSSRNKSESS